MKNPNPLPRGCPYIGVLPSTLAVTKSTNLAIIPYHDVGYCLLEFPGNESFITLYLPYCYGFLLGSTCLSSLISTFVPCTQLGNPMLPTMYYWFSTLVAIFYLFDSITCFVSYILSHLHLGFRT